MTINNEHNKLNVPNLRFPEFQGEWEKHTLQDVVTFSNGKAHENCVNDDGDYILVNSKFVSTNGQVQKRVTSQLSPLHKSQFVMVMSDLPNGKALAKCFYVEEDNKYTLNQRVCSFTSNNGNVSRFLMYQINRNKYYLRFDDGINQTNLKKSEVLSCPVFIPIVREQEKIATLLCKIDERIATQNKIIEDLKKLKSAIIEKVFCSPNKKNPMCRIEGFEQALSTYKMCDFSSRIATKNKDSKCSLVLTIAAQYGLVNQESFFNKSVASENLTGYYLLHKGEFAYNRSYSAGYDWGAVKRLDNYDEGVLSTLYICFKINETIVDSDYLTYYFESTKWHRGLSDIAGEGARNHGLLNVSITDYFNTKHRFPVIEEQKAIAKMLNTITEKERKATLLGECYQKQKQYLLRQMFI